VEEALEIIEGYEMPEKAYMDSPHPGPLPAGGEREETGESSGCWITEAPRGILYHSYRIDAEHKVRGANIIPPTSQNLRAIEEDLRAYLPSLLSESEPVITHRCEALIRNYDPCISCSTHFLTVRVTSHAP